MHRWIAIALLLLAVALVCWWRGDVTPPSAPRGDDGAREVVDGAAAGTGANEAGGRERAQPAAAVEPATTAVAAAAPTPTAPTGKIAVVVVDEADGVLPGCTVTVDEQTAVSDARGRAEFEVPAQRVRVSAEPPAGAALLSARGWQTVRADRPTEVRLVLAARRTFAFWCRLVADEDGRPLRGAQVTGPALPAPVASDADGLLQVLVNSPDDYLDVALNGRARRRVAPAPGFETRAQAMQVPLVAEASLALAIVDAAGAPVPGVEGKVSTHPWQITWPREALARGPGVVWAGTTDLRGAVALANLPPACTLDVAFTVPDGRGAIPTAHWSFVAGRNERRVELQQPGAVAGRVVDDQDRPLSGVMVRALPAEDEGTPVDAAGLHGPQIGTDSAPTGDDGSFRIERLAPGAWWLGVVQAETLVASVQRIEVRAAARSEVTLRARPGLPLAGRAFAPDGGPAANVVVDLSRDGNYCTSKRTGADGRFRFFPLLPGNCELGIDQWQGDLGLPQAVLATIGDEAVELRLVPVNGSIAGRVTGSAWVFATRRGSDDAVGEASDLDGSFHHQGLRAGTWDLHAHDHAGNAAVLSAVEVLPGRETAGVQIALAPAGQIVLQHRAADAFRVERSGAIALVDNLPEGTLYEVPLPPGPWTVVFLARDAELERRDVTVRVGERQRVGPQ